MIAEWPETLPRPERDSWQSQPVDIRRRTQNDAGPPRSRRRLSGVSREVALSVVLSRDLKSVFDDFWAVTCVHGTRYFRMPDPTTDGWPMLSEEGMPMQTEDGTPILMAANWLCAWGSEPPVETIHGQIEFRKSFSVVVLP